jgi:hypothetical protein
LSRDNIISELKKKYVYYVRKIWKEKELNYHVIVIYAVNMN